jgi:hypothetical protein
MRTKKYFLFLPFLISCQGNKQKNNQPDVSDHATGQTKHNVVALRDVPLNGLQVLYGNPEKEGTPFVIRLHNDSGYVVLPHTHPQDENIVVVKGIWMFSMGNKVNLSSMDTLEVGAYAYVPNKMAHFGYAKTEVIIQIHGTGPFSTDYVDSVFQLSSEGVSLIRTPIDKGIPVKSGFSKYFTFKIGDNVKSNYGAGIVLLGQCHPLSNLTQYLIRTESGERFWSPADKLNRIEQ